MTGPRQNASKWGDDVTMVRDQDSVYRSIEIAKRYGGVSWTLLLVKEVAETAHEVVFLRDRGGSTKKLEAKLLKSLVSR